MITALILTHNESKHIRRCILSVLPVVGRVVVIDSNSTDDTREIAAGLSAEVYCNPWVNYATQFNWGLDHADIQPEWILRIDADEVLTEELQKAILVACENSSRSVSGFTVNRRIHFMQQWIKHGGIYPLRMLRIFRVGAGRCEQRWMDEHIVVNGKVGHIAADLIDDNLNDLGWWTLKHNGYASREVIDILLAAPGRGDRDEVHMSRQARIKRFAKERVYARLPLGVRPLLYFLYRYFMRLGFLDGRKGLVFHVLQGFWYRFLVDAKLTEIRAAMQRENIGVAEAVERFYGYKIGPL